MSHPAYKHPLRSVLRAKVAKGGAYLRDSVFAGHYGTTVVCNDNFDFAGWNVPFFQNCVHELSDMVSCVW